MKKLLFMVPFLGLTAGCAYPIQSLSGGYPGQRSLYPRSAGPQFNLASLPVGRWDNVMMSAAGIPLLVLMMNGTTASGEIVSATSDTLRLRVASGEVDIPAADVMRVDRLSGAGGKVKDGARGAALGAGVVGVLGLIAGHVPPPRLFAAGAIVGAAQNYELASLARGAATIYLAEAAVPAVRAAVAAAGASPASRVGVGSRAPCAPGGMVCNPQVRYRR